MFTYCLSLDRVRSDDKQCRQPGSDDRARSTEMSRFVGKEAVVRRRSRQAISRPKVIQFSRTHEEFDVISQAAASAGLARGAFAAEVTLAAAQSLQARSASPLREAQAELMAAAGLVRRIGTNLNQAVAR